MATSPLPTRSAASIRAGRELITRASGLRHQARAADLARRRQMITLAKWILPAVALALLCTIAAWPEVEQIEAGARDAASHFSADVTAARVTDAQYHSVDASGRPYTVTATLAQQDGPERVNLTMPKGDITLQNGTWLMVKAKQGVFMQHHNLLDLSHDVTLYRDDGTTMLTQSVSLDLTRGAAAGAEPVHAEGPFGTLDAQGFTATDKGTSIEFAGPARLVLNGATAGGSSPGDSALAGTTSGGAAPGSASAGSVTSGTRPPGAATEVGPAPVNTAPVITAPVNAAPVDTAPVDTAPVNAAPVNAAPVNATPVNAAPINTAPVNAAPINAAPVNTAPVNTAPVNTAPVNTAPVNTAPVNTAPVNAAPVNATPVNAAPVNAAPVKMAPDNATARGTTWGGSILGGSFSGRITLGGATLDGSK